MTLQEQIEKLNTEYLSGSVHRKFCLTIHDAMNIIRKQSEMLKVAKETLSGTSHHLEGIFNGLKVDSIKKSDVITNISIARGNILQALATIEEMEK